MIVENKTGGGGSVGATETARAAPDGYTLGISTVSTTAANPAINRRVSYNPVTDFTPIINVAATPNVIAVHPGFPARDSRTWSPSSRRTRAGMPMPRRAQVASAHLQTELWKGLAGVFLTHIPYRGSGPALNDVVAGQVPIIFDQLPSTLPFAREGRLVPIVVAAPQRLEQLPNVPTFKEVGLEPVNRMAYYGIVGPRNLPREVPRLKTLKVAEPAGRKAGIRVADVAALVDKLRNEAKVI